LGHSVESEYRNGTDSEDVTRHHNCSDCSEEMSVSLSVWHDFHRTESKYS